VHTAQYSIWFSGLRGAVAFALGMGGAGAAERARNHEIARLQAPAPVIERGAENADNIDARVFHRQWKGLNAPLLSSWE